MNCIAVSRACTFKVLNFLEGDGGDVMEEIEKCCHVMGNSFN